MKKLFLRAMIKFLLHAVSTNTANVVERNPQKVSY